MKLSILLNVEKIIKKKLSAKLLKLNRTESKKKKSCIKTCRKILKKKLRERAKVNHGFNKSIVSFCKGRKSKN